MRKLLIAAAAVSMAASPVIAQTSTMDNQVEQNDQERAVTFGIVAAIAALIAYALYEVIDDEDAEQPVSA